MRRRPDPLPLRRATPALTLASAGESLHRRLPCRSAELLPPDVHVGCRFRGNPACFPAETLRRRRRSCLRVSVPSLAAPTSCRRSGRMPTPTPAIAGRDSCPHTVSSAYLPSGRLGRCGCGLDILLMHAMDLPCDFYAVIPYFQY